jgi:hypothetical protein
MSDQPAREQPAPSVTPHAQPFVCPYCGEEELRPDDEPETWYCPSCTRAFHLELRAVRR